MAGAKCKARVFIAAALVYARYIGDMKIPLRIILILACAILSDVLWSAERARVVTFHGFNNCIALVLNNTSPSIESFYLWNGHVSPPFLALAGGVFFLGFKRLNSQVELLA